MDSIRKMYDSVPAKDYLTAAAAISLGMWSLSIAAFAIAGILNWVSAAAGAAVAILACIATKNRLKERSANEIRSVVMLSTLILLVSAFVIVL